MVQLLSRFSDRVSSRVLFRESMVESAGVVHLQGQILEVLGFVPIGSTTIYGRTFGSKSVLLLGKGWQQGDEDASRMGCLVIGVPREFHNCKRGRWLESKDPFGNGKLE